MNTIDSHNKKMEVKRVGIIHYTLPPAISGVEMVIRDHARLLAGNGYNIKLLGASGKKFRSEIDMQLSRNFDPKNKQVLAIQKDLRKGKLSKSFYDLKKRYVNTLKKWLDENKLQVVIIHNVLSRHYNLTLTAALVEVAEQYKDKVKFISWIHDASYVDTFYTHVNEKLKDIYPWSLIANYQDIFTYVTISETRKKELLQLYGETKRIVVIPNGLDINKMLPLPPQTRDLFHDIIERQPDYIGLIPVRLAERKNLEYAVDFVAKAKEKYNMKFMFLITGALHLQNPEALRYYDFIKAKIKESQLEENFLFLYNYKLDNGEKFDIYKLNIRDLYLISDFLFLPSKGEGFGLPIIEAGFMRIPVFVSNLPVFKEVGNGYINVFKLDEPIEKNVRQVIDYLKQNRATLFHKLILREYSLRVIVRKKIIPLLQETGL